MSRQGFFGRLGIGDGVDNGGFAGTSIPTLPQTINRVGRWIGGLFNGGGSQPQPLMPSAYLTGNFGPQQTGSGFQPIDLSYGQAQPNIGTMLGIPNYAGGDPGFTGANQFLTGDFGPQQGSPGFQPINMDYGQNQQAPTPQNPNGGRPGITSPNPYPQSGPAKPWHDSQGYDTGWRTGEGGTGHGGGWSTVDTGTEMSALNQLLSNAGGRWGDAVRFNMTPEFGTEIMRADGTVRQRGGDSRLIERTGSNRPTTAQEFIRRNPDRWSQMLQQMRQGAGRG